MCGSAVGKIIAIYRGQHGILQLHERHGIGRLHGFEWIKPALGIARADRTEPAARVHTEPISIRVAVPRPQHSAMFGHFDSARTVVNLCRPMI